ncbi:MAG TPA: PIN domain-containing protein [Eoetvoesiella sp.]|uniref:type II toxin-antitoxin system VapC family toxin n=1 Tax=Eoetvoesiella sp. TaxID=1966355 RepID=UPI002C274D33|nr:PIN domain-containing protein [Eoetvoesiella sp.]HWK59781.1 PIN domain-containing protein [Eoetvoesiella sp.]
MLDLSQYDGSAGFLVDTNIWIDCMDPDSPWHEWSVDQLQRCSEQAPLHVNLVIYTELLIPGSDVDALNAMLDVYDTLRSQLPWACAALAARAFRAYRHGGGARHVPLPDFYIGAHAAVSNLSVLSRDVKPYRTYFQRLYCIGPSENI